MDTTTWQEVALAAVNVLQTVLLAYLTSRAHFISRTTDRDVAARRAGTRRTRATDKK